MNRWAFLRALATLFLAGWMIALAIAAVRLSAWSDELVHTLLQMKADATFRDRMARRKEPVSREWYRSKALALIAAGDRIEDDRYWSLVIPGSWLRFDDLRARVEARIEREFSEIAVETLRRELNFKASRLTGVAQDRASGELLPGQGCAAVPLPVGRGTGEEPPELEVVRAQLTGLEELDRAVQDLAALQLGERPDPDRLRRLVAYALGTQLPGPLSRSAALVRSSMGAPDPAQAAVRTTRLQRAALCSLLPVMAALDERLFEHNELLAVEARLARHTRELFGPSAAVQSPAQTLERWRELVDLIGRQEQMLARGDNAWLQRAGASLGPVHDPLLTRIARIELLGPQAAQELRRQSVAALARLQQNLARSLAAGGEPGLVWLPAEGRLAVSPQRTALRIELAALLREPFMAPVVMRDLPPAHSGAMVWDARALEEALALDRLRSRFMTESLLKFPTAARPAVARAVDRQLASRIEAAALRSIGGGGSVSVASDGDGAAWRTQRRQVAQLQALLVRVGARASAEKLRRLAARDDLQRLAWADHALAQAPIYSARFQDFGWWQGEGSPIFQAFGVADAASLRRVLSQQFRRLDELGRQAAGVTDAGMDAGDPVVGRWHGIGLELARWRAGSADSSLLAMQRYLLSLGPQLRGANCAQQLASAAPLSPRGSDEFARRHRQIQEALTRRCGELRGAPATSQPPALAMAPVHRV